MNNYDYMNCDKYLTKYTLAAVQDFQLHQKNLSELEASVLELPAKIFKYEKCNNLIASTDTKQVLTKITELQAQHPT